MGPRTREVLFPPAQHRSTILGRLTNLLLEGGGVIQATGAGEGGLGVSILGLTFIPSSCVQLTLSPLQEASSELCGSDPVGAWFPLRPV